MDIFALNSLLIVSLCVPSVWRVARARPELIRILNLTQDLYAKLEMLAWICDIYR